MKSQDKIPYERLYECANDAPADSGLQKDLRSKKLVIQDGICELKETSQTYKTESDPKNGSIRSRESHGIETPNSWFLLASSPLVLALSLDPGRPGVMGVKWGVEQWCNKAGACSIHLGICGLGEILSSNQICTLSDILVTYMLKVYTEINGYG